MRGEKISFSKSQSFKIKIRDKKRIKIFAELKKLKNTEKNGEKSDFYV